MNDSIEDQPENMNESETFVEGLDFYYEDGLMVLTNRYFAQTRLLLQERLPALPLWLHAETLE